MKLPNAIVEQHIKNKRIVAVKSMELDCGGMGISELTLSDGSIIYFGTQAKIERIRLLGGDVMDPDNSIEIHEYQKMQV